MTENGAATDDSQSSATKRRILDAATLEFAEHGYAGARVNHIATAACANKQLIYRYFGGKQGLYEAVLIEMTRSSRNAITDERQRGTSYLDFVATKEFGGAAAPQFFQWARILGWEGMTNASEAAQVDSLRRANFQSRSEWLSADQKNGEVAPKHRADLLVALLMAATTFPITMPKTFELILGKEKVTDADLQEWFEFVRRLIGEAPVTSHIGSEMPPAGDASAARSFPDSQIGKQNDK